MILIILGKFWRCGHCVVNLVIRYIVAGDCWLFWKYTRAAALHGELHDGTSAGAHELGLSVLH